MNKFKKYIIRKLGGEIFEDLPLNIRQEILQYHCKNAMYKNCEELLKNSFHGR